MQSRTRKLAARVQRALLALSDEVLAETIAHWIHTIQEDFYEDIEILEAFCETLGYRIQSETTGQVYDSLGEFYEAEPEAEDVLLVPPDPPILRDLVRRKQPKQVYHQIVGLAGEALRDASFTSRWGDPPDERSDGYAFMETLSAYLTLKQEAGPLPTERFEALYEEQLAALGAPEPDLDGEQDLFLDEEDLLLLEMSSSFPTQKKRKKRKKSHKQKQQSKKG